jgi:hypothetical protein
LKTMSTFMNTVKPLFDELKARQQANALSNEASAEAVNVQKVQVAATKAKPQNDGKVTGHGAPVYDAALSGAKINLTLPEKKRRPGQAASPSPGPEVIVTKTVDKTAALKQGSAPMARQPSAVQELPHKCAVPTCASYFSGFAEKAQADKHAAAEHAYAGDSLEWMLAKMRVSFGVEVDNIPRSLAKVVHEKPPTNFKIFTMGKDNKIMLANPMPTAMAKTSTNVLNNPSTSTTKAGLEAPASDVTVKKGSPEGAATSLKRTASAAEDKDVKGSPTKKVATIADSWKAVPISREAVHYVFSNIDGITDHMVFASPNPKTTALAKEKSTVNASADEMQLDTKDDIFPVEHSNNSGTWPSPPPITWSNSPDSNTVQKEVTEQKYEPWIEQIMADDQKYRNYSAGEEQMDWNDSGLGIDSFADEWDPSQIWGESVEQRGTLAELMRAEQ